MTATEARERKVAFSVHFCIYGRTLHVGHGEGPFGESARLGTVSWYEVVRIWGSGCDSFFDEIGPQQLGTLGRASGCAGASARAWGPSTQPLAPEVSLRTSGPLRPPNDERWGTPGVDRALRLAKGRAILVFGDAQHEEASTLAWPCRPPSRRAKKRKNHKPSFNNHFIKAAIARGMAWLVVELDPLVGVTCVAQEMLELRRCSRTHLLPALRVLVEQSSVAPDPCHLLMVLNHHLASCWAVRGRSRETLYLGETLFFCQKL